MANKKLKTCRAAKKRFSLNAAGLPKVGRKGKQHNFSNKSAKRKRKLRGTKVLELCDIPMVKRLMPYG